MKQFVYLLQVVKKFNYSYLKEHYYNTNIKSGRELLDCKTIPIEYYIFLDITEANKQVERIVKEMYKNNDTVTITNIKDTGSVQTLTKIFSLNDATNTELFLTRINTGELNMDINLFFSEENNPRF